MSTPHSPDDAEVRFALAWLALYIMLIAGGLAGERDMVLRHSEWLLHTVGALVR